MSGILFFSKKYTRQDLLKLSVLGQPQKWRDYIRIALIDDQGLPEAKLTGLRNRGFIIDPYSDVENIRTMADYPVIISDVNGVACKMDPNQQGIALITELSKTYPFKSLAIYSGGMHKIPTLPEGVLVINKDDDLGLWSTKIDTLINNVANPIKVLNNFAIRLMEAGVMTEDICKIESDFVDRVINKKSFEGFPKIGSRLSPNVESVISGLISNGIFFGVTKLFGL